MKMIMSQAIFSQVDVSLNGNLISPSQNTYPWRSYLETFIITGKKQQSQLTVSGFILDKAGHLDETTGESNVGFKKRKSLTSNSKEVELITRLHSDIFLQEKLMLNGINIKIRLVRSKDNFVLMSDKNGYSIKITHASLFARRCKINPAIVLAHEKALFKRYG